MCALSSSFHSVLIEYLQCTRYATVGSGNAKLDKTRMLPPAPGICRERREMRKGVKDYIVTHTLRELYA